MNLAYRAEQFATKAHEGQYRKYTGEPYIVHPADVVAILTKMSDRPPSQEMIAAAWLHDTVEDTDVTIETIRVQFGLKVAALVSDLTDVSKPEQGNRFVRKEIDRAHTAMASVDAKTIKLADLISNTASITLHDPEFAKTYMREKALLLQVLQEGDVGLLKLASHIVTKYYDEVRSGLAA